MRTADLRQVLAQQRVLERLAVEGSIRPASELPDDCRLDRVLGVVEPCRPGALRLVAFPAWRGGIWFVAARPDSRHPFRVAFASQEKVERAEREAA